MNVLRAATDLRWGRRKASLAIGFFDGVHLGHQQVIRQTVAEASRHGAVPLVVTFDCHPSSVVAPERVPPLIYSLPQKLRAIESLGLSTTLLIHFDRAFSQMPGADFIRGLRQDLGGIQSVCVGSNFTFGFKRDGNVALLQNLGRELGFVVHGMAVVSLDGQVISSTRIREAIRTGALEAASQMLGRAYSLAGTVVKGDGLGHQLGFPTANLEASGLALPPNGVYAVQVLWQGRSHPAVLNIGSRPTLKKAEAPIRVEAHLLEFDSDLYGQELEIVFAEKLRDEQRFPSVNDLKAQIARDIEQARSRF